MTDERPPLYLTPTEAANWFSLHSEDIGRRVVVVVEWKPAALTPAQIAVAPRVALGYDAQGVWVWQGETA